GRYGLSCRHGRSLPISSTGTLTDEMLLVRIGVGTNTGKVSDRRHNTRCADVNHRTVKDSCIIAVVLVSRDNFRRPRSINIVVRDRIAPVRLAAVRHPVLEEATYRG